MPNFCEVLFWKKMNIALSKMTFLYAARKGVNFKQFFIVW